MPHHVEYRPIEGYPNYRVGTDGSVWSRLYPGGRGHPSRVGEWRKLKGNLDRTGYRRVRLMPDNQRRLIHRLVLQAFVGPCPPGMECLHNNGNPEDNRLENLRWGTPKENGADRVRLGETPKGARHGRARLTDDTVRLIRRLIREGRSQAKIAGALGIAQQTVSRVICKETWRHVE